MIICVFFWFFHLIFSLISTVATSKSVQTSCVCLFSTFLLSLSSRPLCQGRVGGLSFHSPLDLQCNWEEQRSPLTAGTQWVLPSLWLSVSHPLLDATSQMQNQKHIFKELSYFWYLSNAETWLCTPPDQQTDEMTHREPTTVMCSIQVYILRVDGLHPPLSWALFSVTKGGSFQQNSSNKHTVYYLPSTKQQLDLSLVKIMEIFFPELVETRTDLKGGQILDPNDWECCSVSTGCVKTTVWLFLADIVVYTLSHCPFSSLCLCPLADFHQRGPVYHQPPLPPRTWRWLADPQDDLCTARRAAIKLQTRATPQHHQNVGRGRAPE